MEIHLHDKQSQVYNDDHRFKVVAAGRRFGKSYLAAVTLFVEASKLTKVRSDGSEVDLMTDIVYYVSPTFKQGRENLWGLCMELGQGIIAGVRQNEGEITLTNGRIIRFKGADDPDSLRGVGLSFVVLDEYAFMKPSVWEYIIRPALSRSEGGALFIGTPAGKNHFYHMWNAARQNMDYLSERPSVDWKAWQFLSKDNPHIPAAEIIALGESMSKEAVDQELNANFDSTGGKVFTYAQFPVKECHHEGDTVLACDLAGFTSPEGKNKSKVILDDHALAVVRCHNKGYHVERIIHGKWDVRETAARIMKAYDTFKCVKMGIEQGIGKNAVDDFILELQDAYGTYFEIHPLRHMNARKEDRIKWALQGRADRGKITLEPDTDLPEEEKWVNKFLGQAVDFPNPQAHDDLIDAVAYAVDQLAESGMGWSVEMVDTWEPLDDLSGY